MQVTDFTTQDGRGSLQPLRRDLARAVSESIDNTAKQDWLEDILGEITVIVTADGSLNYSDLTSDTVSNLSVPNLVNKLIKAANEASIYGSDYKTQLLQDIVDADAILTA